MFIREQRGDRADAEPVQHAEVEPEADCGEQSDGCRVREPRPPEETPFPEPRRERVQTLLPVDLEIEERVEEVESRYPERDGAAERPSRPGEPPRDRNPGA